MESKAIIPSALSEAEASLESHFTTRNNLRNQADAADQVRIQTAEIISGGP